MVLDMTENFAIRVNLERYKSLLRRIAKMRWDSDKTELNYKAQRYLGLAIEAGYDPVKHISLYLSI